MKKPAIVLILCLFPLLGFAQNKNSYFFSAELSAGGTIEPGFSVMIPTQLSVVNGIRLSEFFQVGVGIGVRYYVFNWYVRGYDIVPTSGGQSNDIVVWENYSPWTFPIYADLRGNFVSHDGRKVVPYWSFDAGYTFGDKGLYLSPTVGISVGGMRNNFLVGLFYMGQFMGDHFGSNIKEYNWLDGLGLKIGFQF